MADRNIIKIGRATKAQLIQLATLDALKDWEMVYATDTEEFGVKFPQGHPTNSNALVFDKYLKRNNDGSINIGGVNLKEDAATNTLEITGASNIDIGGAKIQNVGAPTAQTDASTKEYVDDSIAAIPAPPTPGDGTLTLAGTGIAQATGAKTFTANQARDSAMTIYVPGTDITLNQDVDGVNITSSTGTGDKILGATPTRAGVLTTDDQTFKGNKNFEDNVLIAGNLTVEGTNNIVNTETIATQDDVIELRHGATTAITTPSGIAINHYNGAGDVAGIVMKPGDSEVRVGKIVLDANGKITNTAGAQPLLTRAEIDDMDTPPTENPPTENSTIYKHIIVWDNVNKRAVSTPLVVNQIAKLEEDNRFTGENTFSKEFTINQSGQIESGIKFVDNLPGSEGSDRLVAVYDNWMATSDLYFANKKIIKEDDIATAALDGLMSKENFSKLAGIAAGAEKNVQIDWTATTGMTSISNKPNLMEADIANAGTDTAEKTINAAVLKTAIQTHAPLPVFANETEAKAGAATNKVMSPKTTFDAISIAIIDGGNLADLL